MTPPLWQKVKRNWKASWWKWKRRVKSLAYSSTFRKLRSWHPVPSLHNKWWGNSGRLYFFRLQNHCRWWLKPWNKKTLTLWKKSYDQPRQHIKKQRHYFANKGPSIQDYGFPSGHVWMWELDYKESWARKNWCFWTVVLEKILESPLDWREI